MNIHTEISSLEANYGKSMFGDKSTFREGRGE